MRREGRLEAGLAGHGPGVESLQAGDPRILAQARVELVVAHLHADHVACAAAQGTVGEAAGGLPHVEHQPALEVQPQRFDQCLELEPRPGDIALLGVLGHRQPGIVGELLAGLGQHPALLLQPYAAVADQPLGAGAGAGQALGDEQLVGALRGGYRGGDGMGKAGGGASHGRAV